MSFDIYLKAEACEHCGHGGGYVYSANITHNVNEIVERCLVAAGAPVSKVEGSAYAERSWGRLTGWKAREALPFVDLALVVAFDPSRAQEFMALEPSNGWGSLDSVRTVMREFCEAMTKWPNAVIETWG
jgi:hypothetical protein